MQTPPAHIIQHSWHGTGCCRRVRLMFHNYQKIDCSNVIQLYLSCGVELQCCAFETVQHKLSYKLKVTNTVQIISRVTNTEKTVSVFLFQLLRSQQELLISPQGLIQYCLYVRLMLVCYRQMRIDLNLSYSIHLVWTFFFFTKRS